MNAAAGNSQSESLDLAVSRGYLSAEQAATLLADAQQTGRGAGELAVDRGLLRPIEWEIIAALAAPATIAPGYQLLEVIGHGGLGVVYRAQQITLDREVALKTVLVTRLNTAGAVARFQQEAKTIGALRHPNIVTAFDSGTHAGRLYLVMELVEGNDLSNLIHCEGRLDEFRGLWIARQVAGGLAHAAERNIVHRDIKPANILLTPAPAGYPLPSGVPLAKITDFGLALLATDQEETRLTLAGTTMGTPHYMAPEQLAGSTVDFRADIFALGATLYHLFSGATPFTGATLTEIVSNRMKGTRRPIGAVAQHLSPATARLVEEMMAEDPAGRPEDYAMLITRIDAALKETQPAAGTDDTTLFIAAGSAAGTDRASRAAASTPVPTQTMVSPPASSPLAESAPSGAPKSEPGSMRRGASAKRFALIALLLVVLGAGAWAAVQWKRRVGAENEAPITATTGWEAPLFDGRTLEGWDPQFRGSWGQGRDAEESFVLQGRSTPTQSARISRHLPRRTIGSQELQPLDSFRIQLDVDMREAQRVEVTFGKTGNSLRDARALRLTSQSATLGLYNHLDVEFRPIDSAVDIPTTNRTEGSGYRTVKIDYYADWWRVYVDDKLIGKLPALDVPGASAFGLSVEEGSANFANLQLVELAKDGDQ